MTLRCHYNAKISFLLALLAGVACFQVGRDVGGTATVATQSWVEDAESAANGAGTLAIHEVQSVVGAAEEAVITSDTATKSHASVERRTHDDDVIVGTWRAEHVRLTELLHLTCSSDSRRINQLLKMCQSSTNQHTVRPTVRLTLDLLN